MTDTQSTYLQRTRTLLQRVQDKRPNMQPYFRQSVENGDEYLAHRLQLDDETYRDMGEPDVVTLTVHPGDRLNDGSVMLELQADEIENVRRALQHAKLGTPSDVQSAAVRLLEQLPEPNDGEAQGG
jgi:hypothetical protein